MVKFAHIQSNADAEARAHSFDGITPALDLLEGGRDLTAELVIAHTLEQLDKTGVLNMISNSLLDKAATAALGREFTGAKNIRTRAKSMLSVFNTRLNSLHTRISTNPIDVSALPKITHDLNTFIVPANIPIIRNDRTMILMIATLKQMIHEKSQDLPVAPTGLTPANSSTVTTMPITSIRGTKGSADHNTELLDNTGAILAEDKSSNPNFNLTNIDGLANGRHNLRIRITNPTTHVSCEVPYVLIVNVPVKPEAPEGLTNSVSVEAGKQGKITGKLKTPSHTLTVISGGHDITTSCRKIVNGATGTFSIDLPPFPTGDHDLELVISNGVDDVTENIKLTVTPIVAPTLSSGDTMTVNSLPAYITGKVSDKGHEVTLTDDTGSVIVGPCPAPGTDTGADGTEIRMDSNGNFRITLPNSMTTGMHTFGVRVENASGDNISTVTVNANITPAATTVPVEAPEGVPASIDVTGEPYIVSGRLKNPAHTIELLDETGASLTPAITPTVNPDGTFRFTLPTFGTDDEVKYIVKVKNGGRGAGSEIEQDLTVKNRIPHENIGIIRGYNILDLAKQVHKDGREKTYKIKGHTDAFRIGRINRRLKRNNLLIAQVPNEHNQFTAGPLTTLTANQYVTAKTPEELEQKIYERIHTINHHGETAYNARIGAVGTGPAAPAHGPNHAATTPPSPHPAAATATPAPAAHAAPAHPPTTGGHTPHPAAHADHGDEHKKSFFGRAFGWMVPNPIKKTVAAVPEPLRSGAKWGATTGVGLAVGAVALSSAALGALVVPGMLVTAGGRLVYKLFKKKGGGSHDAHGH